MAFFRNKVSVSDMATVLAVQTVQTAQEILDELVNNNSVNLADAERNTARDEMAMALYFGAGTALIHIRPVKKTRKVGLLYFDVFIEIINQSLDVEDSISCLRNRLDEYCEAWDTLMKAETDEGIDEGIKTFVSNLLSNILPERYHFNPRLNDSMAGCFIGWMETLKAFFQHNKVTS
jgi:hypothetical protein